ncbi:MAG: hypothetical protein ACKO7Z_06470 [Cyanobacteriota bacterium]
MPWPLLAGVLPLMPLLVLVASGFTPERRLPLLALGDEPVLSAPFQLDSGWFGSPELELQADLPATSSATLAVDLLDPAGQPVLQFRKDAWRERGVWVEEGEQGTYDERDAAALLALRPGASGAYQLRVRVEELLDGAGQPLSQPLPLLLLVRPHAFDTGLLVFTSLVSGALLVLFWLSVYGGCRRRRWLRVEEPLLAQRLELGGEGLVRLRVCARFERVKGPLRGLQIPFELRLGDAWGRCLLRQRQALWLNSADSDGEVWVIRHGIWLRLPRPGSLRLQIGIDPTPAGAGLAFEGLELLVEDGRRTPWPVAVTPLQPEPAALLPPLAPPAA